jgi:hydroxyacylglutathione hydrolase
MPGEAVNQNASEPLSMTRLVLGDLETNCYILVEETSGHSVVVDPAVEDDRIMEILKDKRGSLDAVWLTHGHYDHIGGCTALRKLTGVDVLIHPDDADMLRDPIKNGSAFFGSPVICDVPCRVFRNGETLQVGSIPVRMIPTPGHSAGSVCFLAGSLLFSGDTLFRENVGRTDLPWSSSENLEQSLRDKVMVLDDAVTVFPGHGPRTTIGHERSKNPFLR